MTQSSESRAVALWRAVAIAGAIAAAALVAAHAHHDRFNAFPDEQLHVMTGEYYLNHWLPPAMSEALAPYAGVHGVSYHMLWPPQATYFVFAKVSLLVPWLAGPERWILYRGLCLALFVALVFAVLRHVGHAPWVFWLVGLTPGVWYIFSYFSADALSYVAASMVVLQLGLPNSRARRFLASGRPRSGAALLGASIGVLALSKLNYLTFSATAFAYCCLLLWRNRDVIGFAKRGAAIVVGACLVAGPFLVADLARNGVGASRDVRYSALRESLAGPGFSASDVAGGTAYYGYVLRERGVPASALFHRPWRWGLLTSRSFFGTYGQMDVGRLPLLNDAQFVLGLALLAMGVFYRRRSLEPAQLVFIGIALAMCVAAIGAAFWRAWVFDFQAQGRYCFAIIPILVLVALEVCEERQHLAHWVLACATVITGLVSFASALPYLA